MEKRAGSWGSARDRDAQAGRPAPSGGVSATAGAGPAGLRRVGLGTWALVSGSRAGCQWTSGEDARRVAEKPGGLARGEAPPGAGREVAGSNTRKAGWGKAERSLRSTLGCSGCWKLLG